MAGRPSTRTTGASAPLPAPPSAFERSHLRSPQPCRGVRCRVHGSRRDPPGSQPARLDGIAALAAALAGATTLPSPATAASVDSTVESLIAGVKAGGEAVKKGLEIAGAGADVAKGGYDAAAPVVEGVVKQVAPVVEGVVRQASPAVGQSVEQGVRQAEDLLSSSGLDVGAIKTGTGAAVGAAAPAAGKLADFLTTTSPLVLAEIAAALYAAYLLSPAVIRALLRSLKGYAGDATAPAVLDALSSDPGAVLVDVRGLAEKEAAGVPDLPGGLRRKAFDVELAVTSDRRLRGQLRDPRKVEFEITAMQIAALKSISKSSNIYIMDKSGSTSQEVAKLLEKRGFRSCYVMEGGFNGWTSSKLQAKRAMSVYRAEVIPPGLGSILGTGTKGTKGTQGTIEGQGPQKALPSRRE